MCRYESLLDGTISLYDLALMNDYLDVKAHNEAVIQNIQHQN